MLPVLSRTVSSPFVPQRCHLLTVIECIVTVLINGCGTSVRNAIVKFLMDLTLELFLVSDIFAGVHVADDTMYFKIRTIILHSLRMAAFCNVATCYLVKITDVLQLLTAWTHSQINNHCSIVSTVIMYFCITVLQNSCLWQALTS